MLPAAHSDALRPFNINPPAGMLVAPSGLP